jgi:AraC family transcriptional regulator
MRSADNLHVITAVCSLGESEVIRAAVICQAPGLLELPPQDNPRVVIHAGPPTPVVYAQGEPTTAPITVYGDIEIVPARASSRQEVQEGRRALWISLSQRFIDRVRASKGIPGDAPLERQFNLRNPQIEHIGWALKAEFEQGCPSGRIYLESMATALAIELLRNGVLAGRQKLPRNPPSRRMERVLAYIDDHLGERLTLQAIAVEAGLSVSLLKRLCRSSLGLPLHQYVIRRRVERAADLLAKPWMPISQVATETGFSHQSHLALHMRKVLGILPHDLRK